MSFAKESQLSFEGTDIPLKPQPQPIFDDVDKNELRMPESHSHVSLPHHLEDLTVGDDEPEDASIEVGSEPIEFILTLDKIPGGLNQEDIEEKPDLEVEEPEEVIVNDDPWDWGESDNFMSWLSKMMQPKGTSSHHGIPIHTGRDSAGLERAIAHFEFLDKCISRGVRSDLRGVIPIDLVEKARDEVRRGIERLEERLEQVESFKYPKKKKKEKKKKAEEEQVGLVKEAQKATHVGGIMITVPLFTSYLARVCINGMISAGHDIEDMFTKLAQRYKLTDRERAELVQLLSDMNYPMRRDRGIPLDEETDTSSSNNYDWAANFHA